MLRRMRHETTHALGAWKWSLKFLQLGEFNNWARQASDDEAVDVSNDESSVASPIAKEVQLNLDVTNLHTRKSSIQQTF